MIHIPELRHEDDRAELELEVELATSALARYDWLEAAQRFERVLEVDPTNRRAMRELATIRRRAESRRLAALARLVDRCR